MTEVVEEKTKAPLTKKLSQNRIKIQQDIINTPATSSKEEHNEQASQIIPGLYLGGFESYRDISDRKDTKSFSVVVKVNNQNHTDKTISIKNPGNGSEKIVDNHFHAPVPLGVTHIDIGVEDDSHSWENLYKNLWDKNTFDHIDTALQSNRNVLVHCTMGTSRSAAVVIAYLVYRFDVTVEQANNFVISKRSQVKTKFLQNLKEIEEELRKRGREQQQNYPIIVEHKSCWNKNSLFAAKVLGGMVVIGVNYTMVASIAGHADVANKFLLSNIHNTLAEVLLTQLNKINAGIAIGISIDSAILVMIAACLVKKYFRPAVIEEPREGDKLEL